MPGKLVTGQRHAEVTQIRAVSRLMSSGLSSVVARWEVGLAAPSNGVALRHREDPNGVFPLRVAEDRR